MNDYYKYAQKIDDLFREEAPQHHEYAKSNDLSLFGSSQIRYRILASLGTREAVSFLNPHDFDFVAPAGFVPKEYDFYLMEKSQYRDISTIEIYHSDKLNCDIVIKEYPDKFMRMWNSMSIKFYETFVSKYSLLYKDIPKHQVKLHISSIMSQLYLTMDAHFEDLV
jgi:hypothetical protein